jgi:hypothetical protein
MPESISVPNSGSFENKENTGSQMGHANKKIKCYNIDGDRLETHLRPIQ